MKLTNKLAQQKILDLATNGCTLKEIFEGHKKNEKDLLHDIVKRFSILGKLEFRNGKWYTK